MLALALSCKEHRSITATASAAWQRFRISKLCGRYSAVDADKPGSRGNTLLGFCGFYLDLGANSATKEAERRTPASCLPPLYGAESGRKVGWSTLSFLPAGEPKRFAVIAAECQRELKEGDKNLGLPAGSRIGSQQPLGNSDWVTIDSSLREELVLP